MEITEIQYYQKYSNTTNTAPKRDCHIRKEKLIWSHTTSCITGCGRSPYVTWIQRVTSSGSSLRWEAKWTTIPSFEPSKETNCQLPFLIFVSRNEHRPPVLTELGRLSVGITLFRNWQGWVHISRHPVAVLSFWIRNIRSQMSVAVRPLFGLMACGLRLRRWSH